MFINIFKQFINLASSYAISLSESLKFLSIN